MTLFRSGLPNITGTTVHSTRHCLQVALAMLRDLSALAPCSLLADAAHVLGMLVVLKDDMDHFKQQREVVEASKGINAVPFLFGVVIYCYEGIGMVLPIEDSMADRTKVRSLASTKGYDHTKARCTLCCTADIMPRQCPFAL